MAIYRPLAEAKPDAYLPALATSLLAGAWISDAYGIELNAAVRDIEEAIDIFHKLAEDFPDPAASSGRRG